MRKLLNKPWFVAVLVAVAAVAGWFSWPHEANRGPGAASVLAESSADASVSEADKGDGNDAPHSLRAALAALQLPVDIRDPFASRLGSRSVETADTSVQVLPDEIETVHLFAVWIQEGRPLVVLNGRILGVGDSIGRLTIASAQLDGIWLNHWRGRDFLPVGKDFSLSTPVSTPTSHEG